MLNVSNIIWCGGAISVVVHLLSDYVNCFVNRVERILYGVYITRLIECNSRLQIGQRDIGVWKITISILKAERRCGYCFIGLRKWGSLSSEKIVFESLSRDTEQSV